MENYTGKRLDNNELSVILTFSRIIGPTTLKVTIDVCDGGHTAPKISADPSVMVVADTPYSPSAEDRLFAWKALRGIP